MFRSFVGQLPGSLAVVLFILSLWGEVKRMSTRGPTAEIDDLLLSQFQSWLKGIKNGVLQLCARQSQFTREKFGLVERDSHGREWKMEVDN